MRNFRSAKKQQGAVLALFAIGMLAIIALAGLALDMSHAYVDKTKLQNALDAAALSGAMTLISSGSTADATDDAGYTFKDNVLGTELADLEPDVEFLPDLESSPNGSGPFVRVKLRGGKRFAMPTWLAKVLGPSWEEINIGGSAVAGPAAAETCNLAPFVVCGDMSKGCFENGSDSCYGFDVWNGVEGEEQECFLKACASGGNDCGTDQVASDQCGAQDGSALGGGPNALGTGSFYLARIPPGCSGANCVVDALKDGAEYCYTPGDEIYPKTGDNVGPMRYYNTKFNLYEKNAKNANNNGEYPPDVISTTDSLGIGRLYFDEYSTIPNNLPKINGGKPNKRVFGVLIADCTNPQSGSSAPIDVKAIGCFFGTQPAADTGNTQVVWGEFLGKEVPGCQGQTLTTSPTTVSQKIILYKDIESGDS